MSKIKRPNESFKNKKNHIDKRLKITINNHLTYYAKYKISSIQQKELMLVPNCKCYIMIGLRQILEYCIIDKRDKHC